MTNPKEGYNSGIRRSVVGTINSSGDWIEGGTTLTVGDAGQFSTLGEANDFVITQASTNMETLDTGTLALLNGEYTLVASAAISSNVQGRELFLQLDGESFLFPVTLTDPGTSTYLKLKYPFYARTETDVDFSILSPKTKYNIVLSPGRHRGDGTVVELPPFTVVSGYGKNLTYYEDECESANGGIIEIPHTSQYSSVRDIAMQVYGSVRGGCITITGSSTEINTGSHFEFNNLDLTSTEASEDGIWKPTTNKEATDFISVTNSTFQGYFDSIALFNTITTRITGNNIYAIAENNDTSAAHGIQISGNSVADSKSLVYGNNIQTYQGQTGFSATTAGIKISAQINTTKDFVAQVSNNFFDVQGELDSGGIPGLESKGYGIHATDVGFSVGNYYVRSINNLFNVTGSRETFDLTAFGDVTVFTANDRKYDGTAVDSTTSGAGTVTVVL